MNNDETQRNLEMEDRTKISMIFKILAGVKFYIIFRWLFVGYFILMYFTVLFAETTSSLMFDIS